MHLKQLKKGIQQAAKLKHGYHSLHPKGDIFIIPVWGTKHKGGLNMLNELLDKNKEINLNVLMAMRQIVPNIYEELRSNEKYKKIDEKFCKVIDSLRESIDLEMLLEFDDLLGEKMAIELDTMYYKGMTDAIQLLKLLKVI